MKEKTADITFWFPKALLILLSLSGLYMPVASVLAPESQRQRRSSSCLALKVSSAH